MLEFFTDHIADFIICLALGALFFLAIRYVVKRKGNACGCEGCSGCSAGGGCAHCSAAKMPGPEELRSRSEAEESAATQAINNI